MHHNFKKISPARFALMSALCLATLVSLVELSRASIGTISKADLTGPWQISLLHGLSGCGVATDEVIVNLNAAGTGTATVTSHTQGCGDHITSQTFTISALNAAGSGTAGLTCGTACGFTFAIQVSPDRSTFNLVDVTDPDNFVAGVAVHQ